MLQSKLFTKTRREAPKDELAKNAELLIRAGFIHKEMAGVYSYLPLGWRVIQKIISIVREEMNAIGGQEIELSALQEKGVWEKTGRWDDQVVDNWFKTKLKNETEVGLAYTHEAAMAELMKDHVSSYRDLPSYPYQFQMKFRNELRSKSGLFRGREFLMKDLYSFNKTTEELDLFYEEAIKTYRKIFDRLNIGDSTYLTLASGGAFGTDYSHEFQTLTAAGEDTIYLSKEKKMAINKEVMNEKALKMLKISEKELTEERAVEVGNIYKLGDFYSRPLGLTYTTEEGNEQAVIMGSYGIGISRLMGTIVEVFADDKGIVWPESVAPFKIHLVYLTGNDKVKAYADKLYGDLVGRNIEVLYDDRDLRAGEKFQDSDLMGIPYRIIVSDKTLESGRLEMKERKSGEVKMISEEELLSGKLN